MSAPSEESLAQIDSLEAASKGSSRGSCVCWATALSTQRLALGNPASQATRASARTALPSLETCQVPA